MARRRFTATVCYREEGQKNGCVRLILAHVWRLWASIAVCGLHVGQCRPHLDPCWVVDVESCGDMSGQRWDHIGLIMAYLEPFWATLGPYWAHDEPFWAVCWPLSCQKHCKCPEKRLFLAALLMFLMPF